VFAAQADHMLAPRAKLLRFVEAAFVTARPTIAMTPVAGAAVCADGAVLTLGPDSAAQGSQAGGSGAEAQSRYMALVVDKDTDVFRVTAVATGPVESEAGSARSAPLLALPAQSVQVVQQFTGADGAAAPAGSLPRLLAALAAMGPLTGCMVHAVFGTQTLRDLLYAETFFQRLQQKQAAARAVRAPTLSLQPA
jgi:hypothetical protein